MLREVVDLTSHRKALVNSRETSCLPREKVIYLRHTPIAITTGKNGAAATTPTRKMKKQCDDTSEICVLDSSCSCYENSRSRHHNHSLCHLWRSCFVYLKYVLVVLCLLKYTKAMSESNPRDVCLDSYQHLFRPNFLSGEVALVTGGGSGIGFRIAEVFMRHDCDTIIMGRKEKRLEESAELLRDATGRQCIAAACDVRKGKDVEAALAKAIEELGGRPVTILVNGAAGNFLCPAESLSPKGFRTVLDIDAVGTFTVSRCVYDLCFKKLGRGVILNISATLYYSGSVLQAHAGAAKAAVDALTRHLAVEWGDKGIRYDSSISSVYF